LQFLGLSILKRLNQVIMLYTVMLKENEVPVRNEEELAEIRWVPVMKLKTLSWSEGPAPQIRQWIKAKL
jgi:8-oxo-dGTP pyrophosphatase MutT (NUDIX family)